MNAEIDTYLKLISVAEEIVPAELAQIGEAKIASAQMTQLVSTLLSA